MAFLLYSESPPDGRLADLVDCFWTVVIHPGGDGAPCHWVLPDGCATLSMRLGPHTNLGLRKPRLTPFRAPAEAGEQIAGVRFKPGALSRLDTNALSQLLIHDFGSPSIDEAQQILSHALGRLASSARDPDRRVQSAVSLMRNTSGCMPVREIAETIGLSERHLERLCVHSLQLTPKEFARTARLQSVIRWMIGNPAANLAQAAAEFRFADQAHMRREFVALGELNPAAYVRMLRDYRFSIV